MLNHCSSLWQAPKWLNFLNFRDSYSTSLCFPATVFHSKLALQSWTWSHRFVLLLYFLWRLIQNNFSIFPKTQEYHPRTQTYTFIVDQFGGRVEVSFLNIGLFDADFLPEQYDPYYTHPFRAKNTMQLWRRLLSAWGFQACLPCCLLASAS